MCPPCRTRYRTYGITKRAKWKAEREAFDREMAGLRLKEDERRRGVGLGPLLDSPEELHAWEISIIDEKVPLHASMASALAGSPMSVEMYPNASTGVYTQDGMGTHFTPSSPRQSRLSF